MKRLILSLVALVLASGCSWLPFWNSQNDLKQQEAAQAEALGVNPYLWQATLNKLNFMGLQKADSKSGTVVTQWAKADESSNESFKVTVNVLCKELRADGLKVQVSKKNGTGAEVSDPVLAAEIEKSILVEAKNILRNKVMAVGN